MNFRILHISDLHTGLKLEEDQTARTAQNFCQQIYERIDSSWREVNQRKFNQNKKVDLLIISGDLISGDLLQTHDAETQFRCICDEFIVNLQKLLTLDQPDKKTIIVPGNHDVDRNGRAVEWGLFNFYDRLKYVATLPEKIPDVSIITPRKDLLIWPVNSVPLAGQEDTAIKEYIEEYIERNQDQRIPIVDPAYVSPYSMIKCKTELNNKRQKLKIAVIHHNPLPFKDEGTYFKIEKYRFINDGQFNHFLVENGFQLVLHGHQHRGRIAFFSTDERRNKDNVINCGFLCIGAPSFGGNRNFIGYNIIDLEIESDYSHTASVNIQQISVSDPSEDRTSGPYLIPLNRELDQERQNLLFQVNKDIHNSKNISKYKKIFEPTEKLTQQHFDFLRKRFSEHRGTRAIYSLSVFPPEKWGAQQLTEFFLPHGKKNIARAVALATKNEYQLFIDKNLDEDRKKRIKRLFDLGHPGLHFLFSPPLCHGIQSARNNARTMAIAELAKTQWQDKTSLLSRKFQDNFEVRMFLNKNFASEDQFSSISIWDNAGFAQDLDTEQINFPDFEIEESDWRTTPFLDDIYVTFSELPETPKPYWPKSSDAINWLPNLLEFPRIFLWELQEFKKPDAIKCIIFHEEFGLPLFWLDPSSLKTRVVRQKFGYVSIFSRRDNAGNSRTRADELSNDDKGQTFLDTRLELPQIWGDNFSIPTGLAPDSFLVDEYFLLLQRKDIMFAADVWAMVNMSEDLEELKKQFKEKISNLNENAVWDSASK